MISDGTCWSVEDGGAKVRPDAPDLILQLRGRINWNPIPCFAVTKAWAFSLDDQLESRHGIGMTHIKDCSHGSLGLGSQQLALVGYLQPKLIATMWN